MLGLRMTRPFEIRAVKLRGEMDSETNDIPLADDDNVPSSLDQSVRKAKPAQPLPREESEDQEEKARLITSVLELQNTLNDLSERVDNVKEESLKLRSENQVLGQYIQNLMASSSIFHPAQARTGANKSGEDDSADDQYYW
uniref:Short coiled-coil protein n=1 Tax=Steinernema glaseri TaxID=37863 RepID=A0A1I7Z5W4_9BILA